LQSKLFNIDNYLVFELGKEVFDCNNYCVKNFGEILSKKIIKKTGPKKLFFCDEEQDTLLLSLSAWEKIKKKINIKKIKNLIYVTETNLYQYPGNGYLFASKTNLNENILIFDLNSGCTGFVEALILANGLKGDSLIVCSESYSKNIKNFDRSVSTLFSDCSTIFYYEKKTFKVRKSFSIMKKNSYDFLRKKKDESLKMNGTDVFNFVSVYVDTNIKIFLKKFKKKFKIEDLYLHQASKVVIDFFKNKKEYSSFKIPTNVCKIGNTVSSSLPMLLLHDKKNLNKMKKNFYFLCGFGVGLGCTGLILEINK
jgi:3-oxoacyl-[acyl-carrier-protein] synthase-3